MSLGEGYTSAFTPSQWKAIEIVTVVAASLGILGALVTCAAYLYWKSMRTAIARIIYFMALGDLLASATMAVGRAGPKAGVDSVLCQLQAAGMQWGDLSSIFWTAMISVNLIWIMYRNRAVDDLRRSERYHLLLCFVVPLIWAVVPIFLRPKDNIRVYGDADLWCWVSPSYFGAQMLLFYGPLWVVFAFNLITYIAIGRLIWKRARATNSDAIVNTAEGGMGDYRFTYGKNVSLYLLAFLLTWTPATLNRIHTMVFEGERSFTLTLLHSVMASSRGLMNCAVYFYVSWYSQIRSTASRQASYSLATDNSMGHTRRVRARPPALDVSVHAGSIAELRDSPSPPVPTLPPATAAGVVAAAAAAAASTRHARNRSFSPRRQRRPSLWAQQGYVDEPPAVYSQELSLEAGATISNGQIDDVPIVVHP